MKQALISAAVAAVVAVVAIQFGSPGGRNVDQIAEELAGHEAMVNAFSPTVLSFDVDNVEDSIVDGTRYTGVYSKLLVDAENSVCYLTKVAFKAMQGPQDSNICSVEIDAFTNHWQVSATVEEGATSEARCNASCLVWE
jgi:hypothetical protein